MQFGYAIAYVPDVEATIAFWERAFGLKRRMVVEGGEYGEHCSHGSTGRGGQVQSFSQRNEPDAQMIEFLKRG